MSPLRKTKNSTRIDLRIPDVLLEKIRELAIENDAPVHHISKKPELTGTIIDLLEKALDYNTSDSLSDIYHDINIKQELETIKGDIKLLKSAIFQPDNTLESLPDSVSDSISDTDTTTDDAIAHGTNGQEPKGFTHAQVAEITGKSESTIGPYFSKRRIAQGNGRTFKPNKKTMFWDEVTE